MQKPIIVIVIPSLQGCGAERVVLNLATGFLNHGCEAHVVVLPKTAWPPTLDYEKPINIHHFKQHYRWIPRLMRSTIIAYLLDKFIINRIGQPDLVLSNLAPADRILKKSKLNVHYIIHNVISNETSSNKYLKELRKIYHKKPIVCVSKGVMDDFIKIFNSIKRIQTIYNPIDINLIRTLAEKDNPINIKEYIIHVGKFKHQKRHDILIKAYHKSGVKNHLVLVGQGSLQKETEILVKSLNLTNKVFFAGFHSNPYPLIKNAKLMVLSSNSEGLGMVILEALALGVPVISTDCSGPAEIVPKINLCPVANIDKLGKLIQSAIKKPAEYKQPVHEQFTLDYAVQKYLDLISS